MSDFKCKKCGNCCSNLLPLSKEDIRKIKEYGSNLKEHRLLINKEWYMICPFLNFKNECDIYEDRPTICREYTCNAFKNKQYSEKFLKTLKETEYKLTNMREEFFGG